MCVFVFLLGCLSVFVTLTDRCMTLCLFMFGNYSVCVGVTLGALGYRGYGSLSQ